MSSIDEAFSEESHNLREIEEKIDVVIDTRKNALGQISAELYDLRRYAMDYDDVANIRDYISRQSAVKADIEKYEGYKPSPYFGHMDFELVSDETIEPEYISCFIGYHGFEDVHRKRLVIDWRSPVGSFYTQKTQKTFEYNGNQYTLLLRRALEIQKAKLIACNTEYDGGEASLEGEVIDPFLLTVLKDKRRQLRLTDIVRTIQENQNEIMRRPITESFAVQGCAGSGKTMILLHRLSVLLYNNKKYPLNAIKIITPNKLFDSHIDELSKELGLGKIERYSVDEYLHRFINLYSRSNKPMHTVFSEKSIDEQLLSELYSLEYAASTEELYHDYWKQKLNALEQAGFFEVLSLASVARPSLLKYNEDAYTLLDTSLSKAEEKIKQDIERKEKIEIHVETLRKNAASAEALSAQSAEQHQAVRKELIKKLKAEQKECDDDAKKIKKLQEAQEALKESLESEVTKAQQIVSSQQEKIDAIEKAKLTYTHFQPNSAFPFDDLSELISADTAAIVKDILELTELLKSEEAQQENFLQESSLTNEKQKNELRLIADRRSYYIEYDQMILLSSPDSIVTQLRSAQADVIENIQRLEQQLVSMPTFAFVRKNQLRKSIEEAKKTYRSAAAAYLLKYEESLRTAIAETEKKASTIQQNLEELKAEIQHKNSVYTQQAEQIYRNYLSVLYTSFSPKQQELENTQKQLESCNEEIQALHDNARVFELKQKALVYALKETEDNAHINIKSAPKGTVALLRPYAKEINDFWDAWVENARAATRTRDSLKSAEEEAAALISSPIRKEHLERLDICRKILDGLSFREIIRHVELELLSSAYAVHKVKLNTRTYRHKLYLRLLTCTLYFRPVSVADRFINIDEAQDISVAEYTLLSKILGSNCVYNLYGDVNQLVYTYKGINDWKSEIPFIVRDHVYVLSENYRNPIPVTDYCNTMFGEACMTPIGIRGEAVAEMPFSKAMQWIEKLKHDVPEIRAAILYRHGVRSVINQLKAYFSGKNVSWNEINNQQISIITVEQAKGLEFEAVVVIESQMTFNEKYVSYTRALERLCVVSETFAPNNSENAEEDDKPFDGAALDV